MTIIHSVCAHMIILVLHNIIVCKMLAIIERFHLLVVIVYNVDRVQQCKLTTLETRRIRGDQIEVFKITHGIEGLDSGMFFKYRTDNGTRGHRWALAKERCKLDIRKYAFSQRTINEWNRLPGAGFMNRRSSGTPT